MNAHSWFLWIAAAVTLAAAAGCGGSDAAPKSPALTSESPRGDAEKTRSAASADAPPPKKKFQPVRLGGETDGATGSSADEKKGVPDERQSRAIVAALQPFQILLGKWKWVTRKKFGDFQKAGEDLEWVWDFQSDKNRPALIVHSDESPYFHQMRLSWLPADEKFELAVESPDGDERRLEGTWADGGEPRDAADGKKLERTYKLVVTQVAPPEGEQWQITFTQVDNNQYRVDLTKRSAAAKQFGPLDSVHQQRLGTSFALSSSDNPGPKCIISGGLGTMTVTYKGKSYPVCCSGCAAAFNDDPERWLARFEKAKAEKEKNKSDE